MKKKLGEKQGGRITPNLKGRVKISLLFYHLNCYLCYRSLFFNDWMSQ
jgi:hypothetical protein